MLLHDLIAASRDEIMLRWKDGVRGSLAPESMPPIELLDHMPQFLDEVVAVLREDAGLPSDPPSFDSAAVHGDHRLRLGFSLDSVVHEYGMLHNAIIATARDRAVLPTFREMQIAFDTIVRGIARAVSEYTQQRDVELVRQANEHFAFIAHELRNPLSSATLAFRHLEATGQLPPGGRTVAALERGIVRTSELIDQTLRIARIASGVELQRESTTLARLFEDVELGAVSEAEAKDVALSVALESDEPVFLDVRLVRSAVGNLLRNAVKYTHSGGTVELRGSVSDGRVVVEVEDCCGGLEPGQVEQAFAPFVRLDHRKSGFGLGLAIAKQAVDAHGGNIRVQNLPGKGCIFVLELPTGSG